MKGFIVDATYRIIDEKPFVFLFGRLEDKESFVAIKEYKPYFFIKKSDLKKALNIEKFEHEGGSLKTFKGDLVVKIIVEKPSDVPDIRKAFEDDGIECYEADIRFVNRFLIDNHIRGSMEINGDYDYQNGMKVFKEPELKPVVWKPELKILSIDIETGSNGEIYCVSLATEGTSKTLINKQKVKDAICCSSEEEMLGKFREILIDIDPDIITGWNVIDFDLKVLSERFKAYYIPFALGRENSVCKLRLSDNFMKDSTANVPGRIVVDAMSLLSQSFIKLSNYKLDTAAKTFLGETKLLKFTDKQKEIDELFEKDPDTLVEYNLKDADLVLRILKKTNVVDLAIERSLLTGMPLDRVTASIASLDSLYLSEARKRGLVCPSGKYGVKEERIKGGFVMEPKPGIYDNILVLDFKSLYPSIIRTFNIDPSSFVGKGKGKNVIKAPNGAAFRNDEGILPGIIQHLWEAREVARKKKDELARYAIKILMNSFFGVMASPNCRFFSLDMANAITSFGQQIIKLTAEKIKKKGYDVIYSDTDSCFVLSKAKSPEEANEIGATLAEDINKSYKEYVKKEHKRESFLDLQYEKCYAKFMMPKLRGTEAGAKKRYAGLIIKDGKEKMEITGMEFVRGDWTDLARNFQYELLDRVFHDKEIGSYIKDLVKKLKDGKMDDKIIYRKSIRKALSEYAVSPPHVKAARQLDKLEGSIIEYVITTEGPEPVQKLRHPINYEHYIKKQLKPIADSILSFFSQTFDEAVKGNRQSSLGSFS